jgi:signal transduction histidine kinase
MIRSRTRGTRRHWLWRRLPLGVKILLPIFAITLVITLGSAVFFTYQLIDADRVARDSEGRTVAIVVQGTLQSNAQAQDPSSLVDLLHHINLAYPDVAAICVLTANPADPLGPLVVFAASEPLTACDPASPLTRGLGVSGIQSLTRHAVAFSLEETVTGAGITGVGRSAVIEVLVPNTPFATLAVPILEKASAAGLLLAGILTGIVFLVLWFSALRPLNRLRLAALAAARAAQPSTHDSVVADIGSGDEIEELSLRFEEMLIAVRDRERELVESNAQLETLISNAPVIVFSADRDGNMLQLKGIGVEAIPKWLGRDRVEDMNVGEIGGPNKEFARLIQKAMAGEKIHEIIPIERWISEEGGEPLHMDLILNPTFDGEGRFAGITGLVVNVTDRMNVDSARAESQQKSAFLAAMSHELRTPLNSIMGFSQLLDLPGAKPALTAKQKRYVTHIISSGSHLLALVGDILDLAKVGAGQLEVNLEAVPLLDLVLDPVDRVGILAAEKNIAIDVYLPPELVAYTDPNRARQMLLNLLSNAVKFTPSGGGRILVSGRSTNGGVELAVADSGIGIAPEDQETIFDEFTQVDRGPSRSLDGTGLGLTLTRRLAALVGGTVRVESAPGVGSTFTIWLPGLAAGGAVAASPAATATVAVARS